jgi:hypothetical protein
MAYVDDVEGHCQRARNAGAKIVREPETHDYGEEYWSDRSYECERAAPASSHASLRRNRPPGTPPRRLGS